MPNGIHVQIYTCITLQTSTPCHFGVPRKFYRILMSKHKGQSREGYLIGNEQMNHVVFAVPYMYKLDCFLLYTRVSMLLGIFLNTSNSLLSCKVCDVLLFKYIPFSTRWPLLLAFNLTFNGKHNLIPRFCDKTVSAESYSPFYFWLADSYLTTTFDQLTVLACI